MNLYKFNEKELNFEKINLKDLLIKIFFITLSITGIVFGILAILK